MLHWKLLGSSFFLENRPLPLVALSKVLAGRQYEKRENSKRIKKISSTVFLVSFFHCNFKKDN